MLAIAGVLVFGSFLSAPLAGSPSPKDSSSSSSLSAVPDPGTSAAFSLAHMYSMVIPQQGISSLRMVLLEDLRLSQPESQLCGRVGGVLSLNDLTLAFLDRLE